MSLTASQEKVLALISAGSSISEAARAAGIHRNTIHNWLRSETPFPAALAEAREAKALYWREQAEELASTAIDAIRGILTDPAQPAAARLKAAHHILALVTNPAENLPNSAQSLPEPQDAPAGVPNSAQSFPELQDAPPEVPNSAQSIPTAGKIGRNDACPCGSGKKYKRCCLVSGARTAGPAAAAA